jgi:hypothetical protein
MVKEITKDRGMINRSYPFLKNFPFDTDFEMEIVKSPVMAMIFDEEFDQVTSKSPQVINFKHRGEPLKASIQIVNTELLWLTESAESIKKLDRIAKRIDRGLKTKDLLVKRDVSLEVDEWLKLIGDQRSQLSHETFNEVLSSLVGSRPVGQVVTLINNLNKIYSGKGLVRMTKSDCDVIFTYLHFRLIYAKLILGIVIASKISF